MAWTPDEDAKLLLAAIRALRRRSDNELIIK